MLSKAKIRLIQSLQYKKFRKAHALFVVEGLKSIQEFIHAGWEIDTLYTTEIAFAKLNKIPQNIKLSEVSELEIRKISFLQNPQGMLALIRIPETQNMAYENLRGHYSLALDRIQDPGNMGTIIRTAEWFGIQNIICSEDCVDIYNPKVVQASMGSLARINIFYKDLLPFFEKIELPIYGALLDGESIYHTQFAAEGIVLMGNEGNGIRDSLMNKIDYGVTIPNFGSAESLNVAVATTVFCSEIARKKING